jgi:hypothetical protein
MTGLRRKLTLRNAGLATLVCAAGLAFSGCFTASTQFAVITPDHPGVLYTIKKKYSDIVVWKWAGPDCNLDVNGNGSPGGPQDRAFCALFFIRVVACNNLSGAQHRLCYAATDLENEWADFSDAVHQQLGSDDCLAVHVNPFAGYNWTARRLGTGGCVRG